VATETIGAIRVTNALNYQNVATNRFKANLGKAQRYGAKQIWKASFAGGGLFASMFVMYALGLWYGAKLIADSKVSALSKYPPPTGLVDVADATWGSHASFARSMCMYTNDPSKNYTGDALLQCACNLWGRSRFRRFSVLDGRRHRHGVLLHSLWRIRPRSSRSGV
jgi:hypothetical protein